MLDYPVGRFLAGIGITLLGFLGAGALGLSILSAAFLCAGIVVIVHHLCWDVLDYKIFDNVVGRNVKRVLFFAASAFALVLAFGGFAEQIALMTEPTFVGSPVPSAVAAIIGCYLSFIYDTKHRISTFLQVEAVAAGTVVSIIDGVLVKFVSPVLATVFDALLVAGAVVVYVILSRKFHTFIYGEQPYDVDCDDDEPKMPVFTKAGYEGYRDATPQQREQSFLTSLDYDMYLVCNAQKESKTILYGVLLDCEVDRHVSGRNVSFTLKVRATGGNFQSQADVDHAIQARDVFLKNKIKSIQKAARDSAISRAKSIGCDSTIYVGVNVEPMN